MPRTMRPGRSTGRTAAAPIAARSRSRSTTTIRRATPSRSASPGSRRQRDDRIGALFVNPGGPGATASDFAVSMAAGPARATSPTASTSSASTLGASGPAPSLRRRLRRSCTASTTASTRPRTRPPCSTSARSTSTAASRTSATCSPTSAPRTSPATSTPCATRWATTSSATWASATAPAIGQVYAELFPERVRAMVLDGVARARARPASRLADDQAAGLRDGPPVVRRRLQRRPLLPHRPRRHGRHRRAHGDGRAGARSPADPAPPRSRRAGVGHGTAALQRDAVARPGRRGRPTVWRATAAAWSALADQYLGIGSFDVYFAVNCLDFEWPDDPAGAARRRRRHDGRVAPLRRVRSSTTTCAAPCGRSRTSR